MTLAPRQSTLDAFSARRAVILSAVFAASADGAFALIDASFRGLSPSLYLGHAVLAVAIALALWRNRSVSEGWSTAALAALLLPLLPIYWLRDARLLELGVPWQPFRGERLMLAGIALLMPHSAVGIFLLVVFAAEWALFWHLYRMSMHPLVVATGEPWITVVYFGVMFMLVVLRRQTSRLERQLVDEEVEAQTRRELMQVATAIRDRASTPLQNLELSLAALKARHPDEKLTLDRMDRAIERLEELRPLSDADEDAEVARVRALRSLGEDLQARGMGR